VKNSKKGRARQVRSGQDYGK
jgi:hypothetical protein